MRNSKIAIFGTIAALLASMAAAAAPDTGTAPVQVTVTVSGRNQQLVPRITAANVLVYQDSRPRPVIDWTPVAESPNGVDLAILIDSSLGQALALQFPDIRSFIQELPASTHVGVAYAQYGSAKFTQQFTADHNRAAAALWVPEGKIDAGGSIYQSVTDLAQHWPSDGRVRMALLVSDGVDLWRGVSDTDPMLNPDLGEAIHQAQTSGVTFYTIFAGSSVRFEHGPLLNLNGQGSLARLAAETGGEAYFQGTRTPIAFKPFLNEMLASLHQEYLLTFQAQAGSESRSAALRVSTELPHVKIAGPSTVRVPAAH
jgi:hypothetical protein